MSKIKVSEKFEQDYEMYFRLKDIFTFTGINVKNKYHRFVFSESGNTAKECFYTLDTHGKYIACNELELLFSIIGCKISLNLHIKMWAEEYLEFRTSSLKEEVAFSNLFLMELVEEYQFLPWVELAIINQAEKIFKTGKIFKIRN
jgi:hypothetical protein